MSRRIFHSIFFPQRPEEVWDYLTKPELIAQWLMENDFKPVLGHEFHFRSRPMPELEFDGIIYCKVLEILVPKKLCYSWKAGPGNGQISMDSIVMINLTKKDKGTELSLEHKDFKILNNLTIFNMMDKGWLTNIQKIGELLNRVGQGSSKS